MLPAPIAGQSFVEIVPSLMKRLFRRYGKEDPRRLSQWLADHFQKLLMLTFHGTLEGAPNSSSRSRSDSWAPSSVNRTDFALPTGSLMSRPSIRRSTTFLEFLATATRARHIAPGLALRPYVGLEVVVRLSGAVKVSLLGKFAPIGLEISIRARGAGKHPLQEFIAFCR